MSGCRNGACHTPYFSLCPCILRTMVEGSTPRAAAALRTEPHWSMACWIAANSNPVPLSPSAAGSPACHGGGFPVLRPEFLGKIFPPISHLPEWWNHQVLQHIFQLPDVTRPGIVFKSVDGVREKIVFLGVILLIHHRQKVVEQRYDVLLPLPQGRNLDTDHIQTVSTDPPGIVPPEPSAPDSCWWPAMTRTLISMGSVPPTRVTFRCWSTRSSFTCMCSGRSPIFIQKDVPPFAASKRPLCPLLSAPVNAPFSYRTARTRSDSPEWPRS